MNLLQITKMIFLGVGSILVEEVVVGTSFLHRVVARTGP